MSTRFLSNHGQELHSEEWDIWNSYHNFVSCSLLCIKEGLIAPSIYWWAVLFEWSSAATMCCELLWFMFELTGAKLTDLMYITWPFNLLHFILSFPYIKRWLNSHCVVVVVVVVVACHWLHSSDDCHPYYMIHGSFWNGGRYTRSTEQTAGMYCPHQDVAVWHYCQELNTHVFKVDVAEVASSCPIFSCCILSFYLCFPHQLFREILDLLGAQSSFMWNC